MLPPRRLSGTVGVVHEHAREIAPYKAQLSEHPKTIVSSPRVDRDERKAGECGVFP